MQKNVIKQGERNMVSRMLHAKSDKETIATWRSDLNGILQVFNVRSATAAWPPLIVSFQAELALNTNLTVSDIRHEVANTHNIVSDTHHDVLTTKTIVSDAHCDILNTQTIVSDVCQDVTNTHTVVSNTHAIVSELQHNVSDIHRTMVESREMTDGKNRSVIPTTDGSSISYLHLAHMGNLLHHLRGLASDART